MADFVSLNTMSLISFSLFGNKPLKSESLSGVLLSVTINLTPALNTDSIPRGEFLTIIACEGFRFDSSSLF